MANTTTPLSWGDFINKKDPVQQDLSSSYQSLTLVAIIIIRIAITILITRLLSCGNHQKYA